MSKEKKPETEPLEIKIEDDVVYIKGRLDSYNFVQLRETLVDWKKDLTLDLKDMTYISSAGMGVFLMIHKQLSQLEFKMIFLNVQPAVRKVITLAGFDKLLNI